MEKLPPITEYGIEFNFESENHYNTFLEERKSYALAKIETRKRMTIEMAYNSGYNIMTFIREMDTLKRAGLRKQFFFYLKEYLKTI